MAIGSKKEWFRRSCAIALLFIIMCYWLIVWLLANIPFGGHAEQVAYTVLSPNRRCRVDLVEQSGMLSPDALVVRLSCRWGITPFRRSKEIASYANNPAIDIKWLSDTELQISRDYSAVRHRFSDGTLHDPEELDQWRGIRIRFVERSSDEEDKSTDE